MAKDPAFLFYPGDWQGGTSTFSRFLKGCYMDVLIAQFNSGHLSLEEIKTVLGSDFGQSWPALQKKFKADPKGLFFNEKLQTEMIKRKEYSKSRADNRRKKDMKHISKTYEPTYVPHMENENGNEIGIKIKKESESEMLKEYDLWTDEIIAGNDHVFEQMFLNEIIPPGVHIQFWIMDHRDLLNRYPKMRPPTQDAFRKSCLKHVRENYKKPTHGNSKTKQSAADLAEAFRKRGMQNADG